MMSLPSVTEWEMLCTSLLRAVVSEMTYTVSSGTLNSSIPYHTLTCDFISITFDFSSSKRDHEWPVWWASLPPMFSFLGPSFVDLRSGPPGPSWLNALPFWGVGIKKWKRLNGGWILQSHAAGMWKQRMKFCIEHHCRWRPLANTSARYRSESFKKWQWFAAFKCTFSLEIQGLKFILNNWLLCYCIFVRIEQ